MNQTTESNPAPAAFWKAGDLHPIKFSYLCPYPYPDPTAYAVYLNEQTKLPERIHLKSITAPQLDYNAILEQIYRTAGWRVRTIEEQMTKAGIEFNLPTETAEQE